MNREEANLRVKKSQDCADDLNEALDDFFQASDSSMVSKRKRQVAQKRIIERARAAIKNLEAVAVWAESGMN